MKSYSRYFFCYMVGTISSSIAEWLVKYLVIANNKHFPTFCRHTYMYIPVWLVRYICVCVYGTRTANARIFGLGSTDSKAFFPVSVRPFPKPARYFMHGFINWVGPVVDQYA